MNGIYRPVGVNGSILAFTRYWDKDRTSLLIAINLGHGPGSLRSERVRITGQVVFGTHPARLNKRVEGELVLAEDEAIIVRMDEGEEET